MNTEMENTPKLTKVKEFVTSKEHKPVPETRFRCIEPRLAKETDAFFNETQEVPGEPDGFVWPGGVMELAGPDPKKMLDMLNISFRKHHVRLFRLSIHEDCGGYGDRMPKEKTLDFIAGELIRAKRVVEEYFAGEAEQPQVRIYAVMFDGVFEIT